MFRQVFHPEVYAGKMARQMARLAQQDAVQARVAEQRRREALRQAEFREELEREGKVAKDAPIPVELAKLKGMKKEKKEGEQGGEEGVATEKKGEEAAIERKPKVRSMFDSKKGCF